MIRVGLLSSLLAACGMGDVAEPSAPGPSVSEEANAPTVPTEVDVATLKAAREAGEVPVLVDVRTPPEVAQGAVPGILAMPMNEVSGRLAELEPYKDGPIYVICKSGGRSGAVSKDLRARGYQAINVAGGTSAWIAAGYPTE